MEHSLGGQDRFAPGLQAVDEAGRLFLIHVASKKRDVDAAEVLNEGAFGKLTGVLTAERYGTNEFILLIGAYVYQSHRPRADDDGDSHTSRVGPEDRLFELVPLYIRKAMEMKLELT